MSVILNCRDYLNNREQQLGGDGEDPLRGNPLPGGYPREQQRECLCLPLCEYSLACSCSDGLKGSGNRVRRC